MKNKKVITAIILCIGAVISLIYGITAGPKAKKQTAPISEAISMDKTVSSAGHIIPIKRHAAKTDFISWGRNPFAPKKTPAKVAAKLTLSGIIRDEKEPKALINNTIAGIGDKIGENTVVKIKQNSVILNDGTEYFELRLVPEK